MPNQQKSGVNVRIIGAPEDKIAKAENGSAIDTSQTAGGTGWVQPAVEMDGLKTLVKNSSILPQCIRAYKNNIAGFGIGIRYIEDEEETSDMAAEFVRAEELLEMLTLEQDTKELFEQVVDSRETYGVAYLEVIRNGAGEVVQVDFIRDVPSIRKTVPLEPFVEAKAYYKGKETSRKKKFRKYKQERGGKVVYFKEFGEIGRASCRERV